MVRPLCVEAVFWFHLKKKKQKQKNTTSKNWPGDFENMVDNGSFSSSGVKLRDYRENHFYGFFWSRCYS